jgi:hypothetical protein
MLEMRIDGHLCTKKGAHSLFYRGSEAGCMIWLALKEGWE